MKLHFIGIGGTGMGAVAGLAKAAGHEVRGSDTAVYPPMSEQLAALGIPVFEGYAAANLAWQPDAVVVGNAHGKTHVEVVEAERLGIRLTSFPEVLGGEFLAARHAIVVAGTHGKTTTTSVIAHILTEAGRDPGCFVGGVPILQGQGWRLGSGKEFVVEGDEYDTAFFDKGSKFFHYHPQTAIVTSIELDHVDIFASLEAVKAAFTRFVHLIPEDGTLLVAHDSETALGVARDADCKIESYAVVDAVGPDASASRPIGVTWLATNLEQLKSSRVAFDLFRLGEKQERFETLLTGNHNIANCVAAIAVCLNRGLTVAEVKRGLATFAGVRRRQELRGIASGVHVFDDYAHHPTAVRETLRAMRQRFGARRLIAAYEPRSATSRRNIFQDDMVDAFALADEVVIWQPFDTSKIPEAERFDPEALAHGLYARGVKASYIPQIDALVQHIAGSAGPGDVVVACSSGSFGGFFDKLLDALGDAVLPARPRDMVTVRGLLAAVDMWTTYARDEDASSFFVLRNESGLVASVALDVYGEEAVLRALVVSQAWRGNGYGWMLADTAVSHARFRGVRRIYLMTEHASDFFASKVGFRVVDRSTVANVVAQSATFRAKSDASVAMRLDL